MVRVVSQKRYDADVLVVGAGPAGASAAKYLHEAGHSVILIDGEKFPRDKVCGDFVGPVALDELERLGVSQRADFRRTNLITRSAVFLDGYKLTEQSFPENGGSRPYGRVIPREQLDKWIFECATQAGVKAFENCLLKHYRVSASGVRSECILAGLKTNFYTRAIIGADGSNSAVARIHHGEKSAASSKIVAVRAYYSGVKGPEDRADLFFTEKTFPGYYWLFPVGSQSANLGVGMVLETLPDSKKQLRRMFNELVSNDPAFAQRITDGKMEGKIVGWPLSTYNPQFPCFSNRLLLTGDAGGLINPLNGEGIQYALLSGRWAAEVLHDCLDQDDLSREALSAFGKRVDQEIGFDLSLARTIINCIRNGHLNPLWLNLLQSIVTRAKIDPDYANTAGGVLAGVVPANQVLESGFIAKTLINIGVHFGSIGISGFLNGPDFWKSSIDKTLASGNQISQDIYKNPKMYLLWSSAMGKDVADLSRYYVSDALNRIVPRDQRDE